MTHDLENKIKELYKNLNSLSLIAPEEKRGHIAYLRNLLQVGDPLHPPEKIYSVVAFHYNKIYNSVYK